MNTTTKAQVLNEYVNDEWIEARASGSLEFRNLNNRDVIAGLLLYR